MTKKSRLKFVGIVVAYVIEHFGDMYVMYIILY